MIEEGIAKDLSMVVKNAKLMGCQEVKSFRHIPLKNVEAVISALQKQIAKNQRMKDVLLKTKRISDCAHLAVKGLIQIIHIVDTVGRESNGILSGAWRQRNEG